MQNERYEEWNNTLRLLRKLFKHYLDYVLRYHHQQWPNWKIPTARNSTAARGNFLETLNMSLNCEWGGEGPIGSSHKCHKLPQVSHLLSRQKYACHDKHFVMRNKFCVATNVLFKYNFVVRKVLSWQAYFVMINTCLL